MSESLFYIHVGIPISEPLTSVRDGCIFGVLCLRVDQIVSRCPQHSTPVNQHPKPPLQSIQPNSIGSRFSFHTITSKASSSSLSFIHRYIPTLPSAIYVIALLSQCASLRQHITTTPPTTCLCAQSPALFDLRQIATFPSPATRSVGRSFVSPS
jgi:hypothetical protein